MKKLSIKSMIFLGLFSFAVGYANPGAEMNEEKETKFTIVSFTDVELGSELSIKDLNGLTLYKESINKKGSYSKKFDLTALPDGDYFFEMNSETEIEVIPFNVVSNQVLFNKEEKKTIFKPLVSVKGKKALVSWVPFDESPMGCKIYYSKNYDLVFKETWENLNQNGKMHGKVYDFSTSLSGQYIFVFEIDGRRITKTVKL